MCLCVWLCLCPCVYAYVPVCASMCAFLCVYVCTHMQCVHHMHVSCISIPVCTMHVCIHTCNHTYVTYIHILFWHSRWAAPCPDQTWAYNYRSESTLSAELVYQFRLNSALGYQISVQPFHWCSLKTLVEVPASFSSRNESKRSCNNRPLLEIA